LAAGILSKKINVDDWLLQNSQHLPHGEPEAEIILQQLRQKESLIETTSCGRVLDAVAAVLGLCYERTYEGEPAMKLESAAVKGADVLKIKPIIRGNVLDTSELLVQIFENREKASREDLAYSAHVYLANGLTSLAIAEAQETGIKMVGFTGGAACNEILARLMRQAVEAAGLRFLVHEAVPSGDGGVSFGQAVVGGFYDF
jgi:hydrogenase maturation protein HypF